MVGHMPLEHGIGVRVPARQQNKVAPVAIFVLLWGKKQTALLLSGISNAGACASQLASTRGGA